MSKQHPPKDATRKALFFIYTETPLHVGCGEGLGAIDLPLQRERMSHLPVVPGSGAKGALREMFRATGSPREDDLFGPPPPSPSNGSPGPAEPDHAGALTITDARLLLLPIRTVYGGWAWATSPMILERLARDLEIAGLGSASWSSLAPKSSSDAIVCKDNPAIAPDHNNLILEDTLYKATALRDTAAPLLDLLDKALPDGGAYQRIRERLPEQLVILSDAELKQWARHGMEVTTRVRIKEDTGAVADGALWSEESLPAESLLWSLTLIGDSRKPNAASGHSDALMEEFNRTLKSRARIFLGGDRTIGRGLCAIRLMTGGK